MRSSRCTRKSRARRSGRKLRRHFYKDSPGKRFLTGMADRLLPCSPTTGGIRERPQQRAGGETAISGTSGIPASRSERYEELNFRFCSEFGMQSYSSPEVAASYCARRNGTCSAGLKPPKNGAGNPDYSRYLCVLYRFPKDYPSWPTFPNSTRPIAEDGVEHFAVPCAHDGRLYWQLKRLLAVGIAGARIEFDGRWKRFTMR